MKEMWKKRKTEKDYEEKQKERGKKQTIAMKKLWEEGVYGDEDYLQKVSDGVKRVWLDPNSVYNSEEWRNNCSKITKNLYKNSEFLKKQQLGQKRKPNKCEIKISNLLFDLSFNNFKYVGDGSLWIDGKNPDFINEESKKIIEFFGDYWHSVNVTGQIEDKEEKERKYHFEKCGYKTLIIWEKEIKELEELKNKIRRFVNE